MRAVVVGAGFAGSVVARQLAEAGWTVTLYEKRPHIAGNMYDEVDAAGVLLHKYGPHLYHSDDDAVWAYISRFGKWREYVTFTSAAIDGTPVPMPFNLNAVEMLLGQERANALETALTKRYGPEMEIPVLELLSCGEPIIEETALYFYEKDYKPYTQKQWGKAPDEIAPEVTARVPFRNSRDNRLFRVKHQYLPEDSYTAVFRDLLDHPAIDIKLNTDALNFIKVDEAAGGIFLFGELTDCPVIFTGAVDELLGRKYGALPYRSLDFEYQTLTSVPFQLTLGVCYPDLQYQYTRILEYRHIMPKPPLSATTIVKEYPLAYNFEAAKGNIPYYPMMTDSAAKMHEEYKKRLATISNLFLVGRLAEYRYYNMDQVIAQALEVSKKILAESGC